MEILLLCIKIFFARILDVSLGTIKTVYIVKEKRIISAFFAFVEVLIWFEVARTALSTEINSVFIPISYALGYATGTYMGTFISTKFIKGHLTINIISSKINKKEIDILKDNGFGLSVIKADGNKNLIIIEIDKKNLKRLEDLIYTFDKKAFIIINDTKVVENGYVK